MDEPLPPSAPNPYSSPPNPYSSPLGPDDRPNQTSSEAVASLLCAILSVLAAIPTCCCGIFGSLGLLGVPVGVAGILLGIVAVVMGGREPKAIAANPRAGGEWAAQVGHIVGMVGVALNVLALLAWVGLLIVGMAGMTQGPPRAGQ